MGILYNASWLAQGKYWCKSKSKVFCAVGLFHHTCFCFCQSVFFLPRGTCETPSQSLRSVTPTRPISMISYRVSSANGRVDVWMWSVYGCHCRRGEGHVSRRAELGWAGLGWAGSELPGYVTLQWLSALSMAKHMQHAGVAASLPPSLSPSLSLSLPSAPSCQGSGTHIISLGCSRGAMKSSAISVTQSRCAYCISSLWNSGMAFGIPFYLLFSSCVAFCLSVFILYDYVCLKKGLK